MSWTEERIEDLRRLWDAGYSASAIGKQIGMSKNAVIGKAHRLGLRARPSPIRRNAPKQILTTAYSLGRAPDGTGTAAPTGAAASHRARRDLSLADRRSER